MLSDYFKQITDIILSNCLYSSPNIVQVIQSRRIIWAGHVARMGEEMRVYRVLVGKPEGRRPVGRPRRRWAYNIRTDLQEEGCVYMDACECGNEPSGSLKCGEFLD